MHEISILYGELYRLGGSLGKRERYGIHKTTEDECLLALRLSIQAALLQKRYKKERVRELSVQIEVLKHLVRTAHEAAGLSLPMYIELQKRLQTISRMATGWLIYVERNDPAHSGE